MVQTLLTSVLRYDSYEEDKLRCAQRGLTVDDQTVVELVAALQDEPAWLRWGSSVAGAPQRITDKGVALVRWVTILSGSAPASFELVSRWTRGTKAVLLKATRAAARLDAPPGGQSRGDAWAALRGRTELVETAVNASPEPDQSQRIDSDAAPWAEPEVRALDFSTRSGDACERWSALG